MKDVWEISNGANRDTLYSFFASAALHLTVFVMALSLTGKNGTRKDKVSFTEVSFLEQADKNITERMKNIAEIKKRSSGLIMPDDKISAPFRDAPLERSAGKTGVIAVSAPKKITQNRKTSTSYFPTLKKDFASGDLFIEEEKNSADSPGDGIEKSGSPLWKRGVRGDLKSGFPKNPNPPDVVKEIETEAVKNALPTEDIIRPRIINSTKNEDDLSDTASIADDGDREKIPAKTSNIFGSGFNESGGKFEKNLPAASIDFSHPEVSKEETPSFDSRKIGQTHPVEKTVLDADSKTNVGITITGEIRNREIIKSFIPDYPSWLKGEGVEPVVVLRFTVLPGGLVKDRVFVKRTSGFTKLDKLAIKEMKKWVFAPLKGKRVLREETGEITFKFLLK